MKKKIKINYYFYNFYWFFYFKYIILICKFCCINKSKSLNIYYIIIYCSLVFFFFSLCWWLVRFVIFRWIEFSLFCILFWVEVFNCFVDKIVVLIFLRIWVGKNCSLWRKMLVCMVFVFSLLCIFRLVLFYLNFINIMIN